MTIAAKSQAPDLGLALSGGTAKVMAHIGVLLALEEAGLPPRVLSATSGGSVIAVAYAAGLTPHELAERAKVLNWRQLAKVGLPRLGLLSSRPIEDFVVDLLGDLRFEDLDPPVLVVTTNLLTGAKTVFRQGRIAPVVRASCSIPQIFAPVEIDGGLYTDGGVIEYLPVETLLSAGASVNVGVNLGAYHDFSRAPKNLLGMMLRVTSLVASRNARASSRLADLVLKPDLSKFGGFDLGAAAEMIDVGYHCTQEVIPRLRELLEERTSLLGRVKRKLRGRLTEASTLSEPKSPHD
jgi:NTE family protein